MTHLSPLRAIQAPPGQTSGPALLTVEQVADLLQVSKAFVYEHGPELGLVKIGGANRYARGHVEAYIRDRMRGPVQAAPPAPPAPIYRMTAGSRSKGSRRNRHRVPLLRPTCDPELKAA